MAKPTPGTQYTTVTGDTLEKISTAAYGYDSKWPDIKAVNSSQVTLGSTTEIPVGTFIIIPENTELKQLRQTQLNRGLR